MTTVAPAMPKRSPRDNPAHQVPEISTRRVLNLQLLVITVLVLGVFLPALYFWHRYQVSRSATSFLARADQLEKEEKWEPAARYLRQYLQVAPSDANVRIRIAQNYDKLAKLEPRQYLRLAIEFHAMARGLAPDRADLHRRLVEMLYESQQFTRAEGEAKSLLSTHPDDEVGVRIAALSAYEQTVRGDRGALTMAQVAEMFERTLAKYPREAQMTTVLTQIYRKHLTVPSQEERDTLADNAMDRLVAADPKSSAALLARYTYRQQHQLPGAEDDIQQALEADPDSVDVLLTAGAYYLVTGRDAMTRNQQPLANQKFQQSVRLFEKVVKLEPDREHGHLGLGQALVLQGMYGRAVDSFRDGMAKVKEDSFDLNAQLVHVLILLNRFDEAKTSLAVLQRVLEKINPRLPGQTRRQATAAVDLFKAKVHIQEKRHRQAVALLKKLATVQAASRTRGFADLYDILMMLGEEHVQLGQWDQAAGAFEKAVAVRPESATARAQAGKAWAQTGRLDVAEKHFAAVLDGGVPAGPDLWLSSVETGIRNQSRLPKEKRDWSSVEQKLASPPVELRDSWQVMLLSADFEIARSGNAAADVAVDFLRRAETLNPSSTDLRQKLVLTYEQLGKPTDADQALVTYEKLSGKSADYYLTRSRLMNIRGKRDEAEQILTAALNTVPEKQQPAIREGRVQLHMQNGDFDGARQDLEVLLKSNPSEVRWIRQQADICLETRDFRKVQAAEDQLRTLEGDESPYWRYYQIRRLLMEAADVSDTRFADAISTLQQLEKQNFSWPVTHLLKGMVAQRLGNLRDAVQSYKLAIEMGETRNAVQELIVELLTESDRFSEAEEHLSRLKEEVGFTPRIAALEIAMAQKQGDKKLAVRLAQKAVEELPNEASLQLQLGNALVIDEQRSEAEAAFLAAVKLAPDDLQAWNGLLAFYQRTNQKEAAAALLGKFPVNAKITPAQRELTIARGFEAIGNRAQAQAHFDAAKKQAPQDVEVQLAGAHFVTTFDAVQGEKLLRDIVREFPNDGRARRRLAEHLASLGDETKWKEANKLLVGGEGATAATLLDRRLQASLLIQRGGRENHEQARRILDELVRNPATSAPVDRLSLARLYEADGNLHEARQQFVALVSVESPDPNHLRQYVDMLLRQGETDAATSWLKKLSGIAPTASDTMALQARWMKANGRGDEIELRMEKIARERWVELDGDEPKARLCNDMGTLYTAIEMHPAAEKWYRRLMKLEPANYQSLALCLVTQGRVAEVIELCKEKSRSEGSLEAASTLAGTLAGGNPSAEDFQAAEPLLAEELKKHPHEVGLLFSLALLRTAQLRTDDAVRHYQQIIELSPRNVAALNNMAYVLSEIPGRRQEALKYIDEALQIAGRQPALLDTKGMILLDDSPKQAIQLLEEACTGLATDPRFHFHLAVAHSRNQGLDDARLELKRAVALNLSGQALTATEQRLLAELKKTLNR